MATSAPRLDVEISERRRSVFSRLADFAGGERAISIWEWVSAIGMLLIAGLTYWVLSGQGSNNVPLSPVVMAALLVANLLPATAILVLGGRRMALRRAALGIIRLILENKLRLPLREAFRKAYWGYNETVTDFENTLADGHQPKLVERDLLDFFADRLKVHLREKGVRHDHVEAVFALGGEDDLVRLLARVDALSGLLESLLRHAWCGSEAAGRRAARWRLQ